MSVPYELRRESLYVSPTLKLYFKHFKSELDEGRNIVDHNDIGNMSKKSFARTSHAPRASSNGPRLLGSRKS